MPTIVAAGLITWGVPAAVAAVSGAVVQGAIAGAVIGGGVELLKGGNTKSILKRSFQGAAIGGATGGAFSAGSMAASGITGGTFGSTSAQQLGKLGVEGFAAGSGTSAASKGASILEPAGSAPGVVAETGKVAGYGAAGGEGLLSDATAKLVAGVGQGAAQGGVGYLAAKESADAQAEAEKRRIEEEKRRMEATRPIATERQPIRFSFANRDSLVEDLYKKWGITAPKGAAANA
jgi:hypothetical protein